MREPSKSSILVSALVGTAVGAGIALLLAPKTGKEMRNDLKQFAGNTRDQLIKVVDKGREVVPEAIKAGRETYNEGAKRLEELTHKKERSLMVPMLASGIIGMGIAFLLAPKSGKETRKDLKQLAANTLDSFGSVIDKGKALYQERSKPLPGSVNAVKKTHLLEKVKPLRHAA